MKKLPFFLITLFFLVACNNNNDEPDSLSGDQIAAIMEETGAAAADDIIDLMMGDGAESVISMLDVMSNSSLLGSDFRLDTEKARILQIARLFAQNPNARVSTEEDPYPTGIFYWDELEGDFVFQEESENLILKFPVGSSATNNGEFTMYRYEFFEELPSNIKLDIKVDGSLKVKVDLVVNWSQNGYPEDGEIYLLVDPYTLDVNYNLTDGLTTTISVSLLKGNDQILYIGLETSAIFNLESFPVIEGGVAYRRVSIEGSIDAESIDHAISIDSDPNDHLDLSLSIDNSKVGDIVLILVEEDGYADYMPFLKLGNGNLISLEEVMLPFIEAIEEELGEFEI